MVLFLWGFFLFLVGGCKAGVGKLFDWRGHSGLYLVAEEEEPEQTAGV